MSEESTAVVASAASLAIADWGFTVSEGERGLFDHAIERASECLVDALESLTSHVMVDDVRYDVLVDGVVKIPRTKGVEGVVGKAFRDGPVVAVGNIQVDVVDVYAERKKKAAKAINKFVKDHSADYPQLYALQSNGNRVMKPVSALALEVVCHHETKVCLYKQVLYDLCRDYKDCAALVTDGEAAQEAVADQLVPYSIVQKCTFMLGLAQHTPASWYQLQKLDRAAINRLAVA